MSTNPPPPVPGSRRAAKLRPPSLPVPYLPRARLADLLDSAPDGAVTVIRAGAGSGKTTLAAAWVAESDARQAWLSLDISDADAATFWMNLVSALRQLVPACGDASLALLRRAGGSDDVAAALRDDLTAADAVSASVLVIDDLHIVDGVDEIIAPFSQFVLDAPMWLHVVLLSRRELALPRDQLTSQGRLREVLFAELKFSPAEARALLSELVPALPYESVDIAATRADGWAVGLRLAALAARTALAQAGPRSAALDPDRELVQNFVLNEVLAAEDLDIVRFMSDVSVVARFNANLAAALTGRADASELIGRAEARGLFVTPLDADGWFELHSAARDALSAQIAARSPRELSALHSRAAIWFAGAGDVSTALDHWLLADRQRDALRLLAAEHANLYDDGGESIIRRTVAALGPEVATADLDAMVEFAWCHLLVDLRRFLELVQQMTWWGGQSDVTIGARVTMLESVAATVTGRWVEGGQLARRAMKDLGPAAWQDPLGDPAGI